MSVNQLCQYVARNDWCGDVKDFPEPLGDGNLRGLQVRRPAGI